MADRERQVWHVARSTYGWLGGFLLVVVVAIPLAAWFLHERGEAWPIPTVLLAIAVAGVLYAWRYGLHPRIVADDAGLRIVNPFRTHRCDWADVVSLTPGPDGLVLKTSDTTVQAWCVQTSQRRIDSGELGRAAAVIRTLLDRVDRAAPGTDGPAGLRRARPEEGEALMRIERAAGLAALAHVFPPDRFPYPDAEVARRWRATLVEPGVRVVVATAPAGSDPSEVVGVIAYDDERVRHLAVLPASSGAGIGSQLLEWACDDIFDDLDQHQAVLWVLETNTVAREFYSHRGWRLSDERRQTDFPPHPVEVQLVLANPRAARRRRAA